ncbi:MAG: hypothetical protein A3I66_21415 [Burkholderiales bacterium RIFCSPLOWO2_02_FULL_57_36]|nr:MAG: hypothetical protein A3I66_21415 [Burkholderiales bacterium RIFCSPLOWO2_02_FULL_57_36]
MNNNCCTTASSFDENNPWEAVADHLNRECHCINVDASLLQQQLDKVLGDSHVPGGLIEQRPHLFAKFGVFATQRQVDQMARIIKVVEQVVSMPAYRQTVLGWAPEIAHHEPGALGVFFGYDFHLGADGPRLVEINTNAGGAMLNTVLAKAQLACCDEVRDMMDGPVPIELLEDALVTMFAAEWEKSGAGRTRESLKTIAIVDAAPEAQYLYPEFLLFQDLFARRGIQALILDPQHLEFRDGVLWHRDQKVDLVYNRLTDFDFSQPQHAALRAAYLADAAVITPHPRAHALYANKRNLVVLTDAALLRGWGLPEDAIDTLTRGIPRTVLVSADNAEALWSQRRQLFFKPASGFGSRAVYRGDKVTKRVWEEILAGDYVAQTLVLPSARRLAREQDSVDLKLDVRAYAYDGGIQLLAARMYQGQTTNFRTEGGGFAPIYTIPSPV